MSGQGMVERCAKVLASQNPGDPWRSYVELTRAVLAELREPTEAMLECDEWTGGNSWQAMIDAALSEDRQ